MKTIDYLSTLSIKELKALYKDYKGASMSVSDMIMIKLIGHEITKRQGANHD